MSEWIKKETTTCHPQGTLFKYKGTHSLRINRWRKMYHVNTNQKKVGVAILVSDKTDLRARKVIQDKEEHYLMIKGSILQENVTILMSTYLITEHQNI